MLSKINMKELVVCLYISTPSSELIYVANNSAPNAAMGVQTTKYNFTLLDILIKFCTVIDLID